jgi:hypothetical protein
LRARLPSIADLRCRELIIGWQKFQGTEWSSLKVECLKHGLEALEARVTIALLISLKISHAGAHQP